MFLAPLSWSRLNKNHEPEPEPLGKKSGAGAAKKLVGSSALLEDKNIRYLYQEPEPEPLKN